MLPPKYTKTLTVTAHEQPANVVARLGRPVGLWNSVAVRDIRYGSGTCFSNDPDPTFHFDLDPTV
jgi:hypothetical protein